MEIVHVCSVKGVAMYHITKEYPYNTKLKYDVFSESKEKPHIYFQVSIDSCSFVVVFISAPVVFEITM